MKEEGAVKIEYSRPRPAECDGKSEKSQNTNECGGMVQDKSLQLMYLNKRKHTMLVISRLQPRNSESKWVGDVKSKMKFNYMPSRVYSIGVNLINF